MITPPRTIEQLKARSLALAGKRVAELATHAGEVPNKLTRQKGWLGQLLEQLLGADAGNEACADFRELGIELKTLPVDFSGKVLESTWVCILDLKQKAFVSFEHSLLWAKLQHVLWVPVARPKNTVISDAVIGTPFFWQPNQSEKSLLQADWEYAMDLVSRGQPEKLNAKDGEVLQVRPKAAHSRVVTQTTNMAGEQQLTLPRGFYLRATFTQQILDRNLYH